jgi:hypothetical protein
MPSARLLVAQTCHVNADSRRDISGKHMREKRFEIGFDDSSGNSPLGAEKIDNILSERRQLRFARAGIENDPDRFLNTIPFRTGDMRQHIADVSVRTKVRHHDRGQLGRGHRPGIAGGSGIGWPMMSILEFHGLP